MNYNLTPIILAAFLALTGAVVAVQLEARFAAEDRV